MELRDVASGNWTTNLQIVGLHGYRRMNFIVDEDALLLQDING